MLVYCEPKKSTDGEKQFDFQMALPIEGIEKISELKTDDPVYIKRGLQKENGFSFLLDNQTWVLHAPNSKERNSWMNDMILLVSHDYEYA